MNLVENVIPVVIALKKKLEAAQSPLLRWLLMFLRDLMRDYKAEAKDMLAADKKLAMEMAFDLRRLESEEKVAAADHPPVTPNRTPGRAPNPEMQELLDTARKLREEAVKCHSIIVLPEVADAAKGGGCWPRSETVFRRPSGTMKNQRGLQSFVAAMEEERVVAIMNSRAAQ